MTTNAEVMVGMRSHDDAEEAHRRLEAEAAGPDQQTQYTRGALTGYLWALGRGAPAPITGQATDGPPSLQALSAEVAAATVQMGDSTQRTVPRDYIHGVRDALAWVCGQSETRPRP
ncbi:hypothetical protein [Streptomyces lavendofoliae]|uniref:hypothetical protein n=1 Tax=Streptomyces lavendofoliae TaxID=67314 RepID=UPI00300F25BD